MKSSIRLAWMFIGLAALSGCAKLRETFGRLHNGSTLVRVNTGQARQFSSLAPILTGGLMVYATDQSGNSTAASVADETQPLQMSLPNGTYSFTAFGWDMPNIGGVTPRCGTSSQTYTLTGVDTDVTISMNPTNCGNTSIYSPSYAVQSNTFIPLHLVFCGAGVNVSSFTYSSLCTNGLESALFLHGYPSAAVSDAGYFPSINKFVYVANSVSSSVFMLYGTSPGSGGKDTIRLAPPMAPGGTGMNSLGIVPNSIEAPRGKTAGNQSRFARAFSSGKSSACAPLSASFTPCCSI
jgi:hypothetical protein